MPKVSLCIPSYNNADEVRHLLETIYEQEYTDFEINISDDSTNDEIADVVAEYEKKYGAQKLNYIHNQKALGHIFNWNAAIKMATGEYIKIMFSDDWFTDSKCLGKFVHMLDQNPDVLLAFSGSRQVMLAGENATNVRHVTQNNVKSSYDRHASDDFISNLQNDYRNLFLGNQIGTPSATIYRRDKFLALFDEKSNWASDMFIYFDLLKACHTFAYTKEPLICVGVHENQYTETFSEKDERIYNDYKYMYQKYELQDSDACREYFTEQYLIKFGKNISEAKSLGVSSGLYIKKWINERKETVRCFVSHRLGISNRQAK